MACFVAPAAEAIVTTIVQKVVERQERKNGKKHTEKIGITWSRKLSWLNKMLWGGTILLAFEHAWHGEIVPWWPFLTAMKNPTDIAPMLQEIATVGVAMTFGVTIIWGIIVFIADQKAKGLTGVKPASIEGAR
jgi:hypothetical protein